MRIGIVCGSYPPLKCGIGDYTAHLAAALTTAGHEVTIVTSRGGLPGGAVHVVPAIGSWSWAAASEVLCALGEAGVEVVNVQYPTQQYGRHVMVNVLPWLVSRRLGVPTVATVHEFGTFTALGRLRLALSARLSRMVISTDGANRRLLRYWAGGPDGSYALVPIGSNLPCSPPPGYDRAALRASLGAMPSSVVLAFLGFVSPNKGLEHLLVAFEQALAAAPEADLRLWLLADREPAAERYRAYHGAFAAGLGRFPHRDRIDWTGYLEPAQVSAHLLAADIAVLPFGDGASLRRGSLLAALAHGLPVISTLGSTTAEDGLEVGCGLSLVPPAEPAALARAILDLVRDRPRRREMAAQASRFAATITWPQIAARTLAVFEQALGTGTLKESAR